MPILTMSGRVAIAESLKLRPIHLAWGLGNGVWTTTRPAESVNATGLVNEIGRRVADEVSYVVADAAGTIVLPTGTFSASASPTNNLYIRTKFVFADAPASTIREVGAFVGCATDPGLPVGQKYFTPAQVVSRGRLLHLDYFQPIFRSAAIEESFEIVITF